MTKRKVTTRPADSPEVLELFDAIAPFFPDAEGFDGVIVRSVSIKFATEEEFFSGAGAAKSGGRWNSVGMLATYASLDVVTATKEAYQTILKFGFSMTSISPRVTAAAKVRLGSVLDLTHDAVLNAIGFSIEDLINEDWRSIQSVGEESWTQAIGRAAIQCGFEAILVPSAQHDEGRNIVIFPQNIAKTSKITVLHAGQLPN
jgi:RES domain-containing protein